MRSYGLLPVLGGITFVASLALAEVEPEQSEFFESRIRPVLAQDCYECHNSQGTADGGLVLDHRAGLLKGGDRGPAIVPGKPHESLLVQAIRHDEEDLLMPSAAPKLDEVVIRDFVRWVRMGAPDPRDQPPTDVDLLAEANWPAVMERRKGWWSFQPILDPAPPAIAGVSHPIDRFVRSRLADTRLMPAEPADKQVLLRRLTFALTGLPPTEAQIDRFMRQTERDAATQRLINELIDSPHFGERWARHWMDWIRYAESHGSEGDPPIENAWLYRDYLIRALNDDIPFDQLVREHVAGDLIAEPRLNHQLGLNESLIGTAHWRMVFHGFAPTDALDERVRFTDDQINVFSKAFLGLTVSCARCHNHKFDAISQADYYAMFGVLGSTRPGRRAIDLPLLQATNKTELVKLKARIRDSIADAWMGAAGDLEGRLLNDQNLRSRASDPTSPMHLLYQMRPDVVVADAFAAAWQERVRDWVAYQESRAEYLRADYPFRADLSEWFREGVGLDRQPSKPGEFSIQPEGERALQAIYPAGVFSHLLSQKHPARLTSPDFPLNGTNTLWLRVIGGGSAMARYVVQNYPRDGTVYPYNEFKGDDDADWQWLRYNVDYWDGDDVHIELTTARDAPLLTKASDQSWFGISDAVLKPSGSAPPVEVRDFLEPLFAATEEAPPSSFEDLAAVYGKVVKASIEAWRQGDADNGVASFLNGCLSDGLITNELQELGPAKELIEAYRDLEAAIPVPTRVPTLSEWRGSDQPLFNRGNHKEPLDPVSRRFLEAIDATPYKTQLSGRLELAEDLLRADNPFTRRVIVNRVWHHLFGRGIVPSTDNFGRMGEEPSHPEMLDYLATRFVNDGWSLKNLIRLIVTSETWQQGSVPSSTARESDPENKLLSHFNIRRLEAESIRDSLLAGAGALDRSLYGPPVDGGADRRSVYVSVIRNRLDPFLSTFDAPVPFSTKGRRDVTTVPAQSLALLNDPFVLGLASRAASTAGSREEFVRRSWLCLLGRNPTPGEQFHAEQLIEVLESKYAEIGRRRRGLKAQIAAKRREKDAIEDEARSRMLDGDDRGLGGKRSELLPMAHWDFEDGFRDSIGTLHGEAKGSARLDGGSLMLDGSGWVSTAALPVTLEAKTLQARVVLNDLEQRGGGVVTVQTLDGAKFDSIVFGEDYPKCWLAGSDYHRRTEHFGGAEEVEARDRPVVISIVYGSDGTIIGYRDGKPYGQPYKTIVQAFRKDNAHVAFGLRHGTAVDGDRMLRGRILDATLFDRALTPDEVFASAVGDRRYVSEAMLFAGMPPKRKSQVVSLKETIESLETELASLQEPVSGNQAYADLVLSLFNTKEFIHVR